MTLKIEYAPFSTWFGYWRSSPAVRDLGDVVIWVFKYQITIWFCEKQIARDALDKLEARNGG